MWPSTRRSYSSASVNCSSGSEPGCAGGLGDEVGDDRLVERTPARAAGGATASSSSAGDSGDSTNAPSPTSEPITGVLQRPVEQVGADRRDDADVDDSSSIMRATTSRNSSRSVRRALGSSTPRTGRPRPPAVRVRRRRRRRAAVEIVGRLPAGRHLRQRRAEARRPDRRRGPSSTTVCPARAQPGDEPGRARASSCPNPTRRRRSRDGCRRPSRPARRRRRRGRRTPPRRPRRTAAAPCTG